MDWHAMKYLLAASLILSLASAHFFDHKKPGVCAEPCKGGENDICLDCASSCVKTCENPTGGIENGDCTHVCQVNACQCAEGYVRAQNNRCVLPNQCPQVQPILNPAPPLLPKPLPKPLPIALPKPLPISLPEPLLISSPKPLPIYPLKPLPISLPKPLPKLLPIPELSHPKCPICTGGLHDHCVECGSSCPATCGQHKDRVCTQECKINVCQCDSGYARASNGACILECDCPQVELVLPPLHLEPLKPLCPICTGGAHDHCVSCGSACPPTCGLSDHRPCTEECRINVCQCDKGYKRAPNGKCVPEYQCPQIDPIPDCEEIPLEPKCPVCTGGKHDHCVKCGTACPPTCGLSDDRPCTRECKINVCQCDKGYKRAPNGKCVPEYQCPQIDPIPDCEEIPLEPKCPVCTGGKHDHCVKCGTACPPTCGLSDDRPCTRECKINVCQCDKGYKRAPNGKCVPAHRCPQIDPFNPGPVILPKPSPPKCPHGSHCPQIEPIPNSGEIPLKPKCPVCTGGKHDHCVECGSACPATCGVSKDRPCTLQCKINVCECDEGYARAPNGKCIPEYMCPHTDPNRPVPESEEESCCPVCTGGDHDHCVECGSSCPPTCGLSPDRACAAVCKPNVCQCDDGYSRAQNGTCIPDCECPKCPVCTGGKHDHCTECGSSCPLTCSKPPDACPAYCKPYVCECDKGYVRGPTGKCIRRSKCPRECRDKKHRYFH